MRWYAVVQDGKYWYPSSVGYHETADFFPGCLMEKEEAEELIDWLGGTLVCFIVTQE